jgi:heme/copper-type cytochrome/quinol oxidase subunit 1
MAIAVPTGVKIFSWLRTRQGTIFNPLSPLTAFTFGFLFLFTFGGLTGILLSSRILDISLHDTFFVVGHFHFVLRLGAVFGLVCGIFLWFPLIFGVRLNRLLGMIHFNLLFSGANLTFIPFHFLGLNGIPRRFANFPDFIL